MWSNPTMRADYESALDSGKLYVAINSGKYLLCRRNGKTKTWKRKRDANRFYIPFKYGFKGYGSINQTSLGHYFRIADSRMEAELDTDGKVISSQVVYGEKTEHGITAYVEK